MTKDFDKFYTRAMKDLGKAIKLLTDVHMALLILKERELKDKRYLEKIYLSRKVKK